jgi:hypothetical protein
VSYFIYADETFVSRQNLFNCFKILNLYFSNLKINFGEVSVIEQAQSVFSAGFAKAKSASEDGTQM